MDVLKKDGETKLHITTDQEQIKGNRGTLIFIVVAICIASVLHIRKGFPWMGLIPLWMGVWLIVGLPYIHENCEIILSRSGCVIEFWKFHKNVTWDNIKYKKYVHAGKVPGRFLIGKYESRTYRYDEAIVFSKHRNKILRWLSPLTFNVNFYQKGTSKGNGDYHGLMDAYEIKTGKRPRTPVKEINRLPEVHVADKKEFLSYMALWGIEIENLSVIDRLDYGIKD